MTQPRNITAEDWRVLEVLGSNPERLAAQFQKWFDAGYITPEEGEAIWYELDRRLQTYQREIPLIEATQRKAREAAAIEEARKAEEWRTRTIGMKLTPEAYTEYVKRQAWEGARPDVEYTPAVEELRTSFEGELPQTEYWRDWFNSRYPRLVQEFQATLPKFERKYYPGLGPEEASEKIKESWAARLKALKPQLKEEYYKQSPYQRGERPSVYAPRIQKVGFG